MIVAKTQRPIIQPGPVESTAFTSLLMGIFLNSPLITSHDLRGLRENDIYSYYGAPFLQSLHFFGEKTTLQQIQTLHLLQR